VRAHEDKMALKDSDITALHRIAQTCSFIGSGSALEMAAKEMTMLEMLTSSMVLLYCN
jgi:hypothetical protein